MIEFFLDGKPQTVNHQTGRVITTRRVFSQKKGRVVTVPDIVDSRELTLAKHTIEQQLWPHKPARPFEALAVSLVLEFCFPWTSEHTKKVRALGRIPKATRPDCENIAKTFVDRMTHLRFFTDDGLIAELIVRKWYADRPGVLVSLDEFVDPGASPLLAISTTERFTNAR